MGTTVRLSAESKYGCSGQYLARITGRAPRVQFARTFLGSKSGKRGECTSCETDEPGLYEECDVGRSGKTKSYAVVLPWRGGLRKLYADLEDSLLIAKRLDEGQALESIVQFAVGEPLTDSEWYYACRECGAEFGKKIDARCPDHPNVATDFKTRQIPRLNEDGTAKHELVYLILPKDTPKPDDGLTDLNPRIERGLIIELALAIEDPAGIEAVRMARLIVELVWDRKPEEVRALTAELMDLASRWQRQIVGK